MWDLQLVGPELTSTTPKEVTHVDFFPAVIFSGVDPE
jgi:hypothetical protein